VVQLAYRLGAMEDGANRATPAWPGRASELGVGA
jgi:hypothetical protein